MTLTTLDEREQKADCLTHKWKKASLRHEKSKENQDPHLRSHHNQPLSRKLFKSSGKQSFRA